MISKLDLYRIFATVSKQKSFSKAGSELYMSQPAISQSIMQLERELDIRLFTRMPKGVILTKEGEILYEYIKTAINFIELGEKKIRESKELIAGDLQIGVGDTISRYFLLPYLEKFHEKYPNINLKIINRTTLELCNMLKSGEIEIALCNLPIEDSSIECKKCMNIHDIFVCGEKYKKIIDEWLTFKELTEFPLVFLEANSNTRHYVEEFMLSKGVKINPEIELGSHDLLLEFASINLGISCVIKEFSNEYLQKGVLYEVKTKDEIPERAMGYCFLKNVSLSPSTTEFIKLLEE